ncbi:PfkB family carbohydrate kinase [Actinosynnema sp. NPDC050436]|uniref:carbohydrate kinase family protein n=1 Tax=Actinosynnema sp. NPDC050436 TaxID=3155659 RepID=UPI0033D90EC9
MTVVGSVVLDNKWFPVGSVRTKSADHPLWHVHRRHGGVGRNVAENLARLGVPVFFTGLSGWDAVAAEIEGRLTDTGVRLAVVRVPDGVGRFDVHLDHAGELVRSRICLPDAELLTWDAVSAALPDLGGAAVVAVETGSARRLFEALRFHTSRRGARLLGMPTQLVNLGPRWKLVRQVDILVLNQKEAALLTGLPRGDLSAARDQVRALLAGGPSTVVLTCGGLGAIAASAEDPEPVHYPAQRVTCVDDTGAGDALTAALVAGLVSGADLATSVRSGLDAARVTVGCPAGVCRRVGGR